MRASYHNSCSSRGTRLTSHRHFPAVVTGRFRIISTRNQRKAKEKILMRKKNSKHSQRVNPFIQLVLYILIVSRRITRVIIKLRTVWRIIPREMFF